MKASTIRWHLARDNQIKLARFCQKYAVRHFNTGVYMVGDVRYFQHVYWFNPNLFVRVEMRAGDTKSYTVADHFQVVDYEAGI